MIVHNIGNRHSLAADGLDDAIDAKIMNVRIVVSDVFASSVAGQLLASCLANLLCRQKGIVQDVEVVAVTTPLLITLPSGFTDKTFPECLGHLSTWAVDNAVPVSATPTTSKINFTIFIGCGGADAGTMLEDQALVVLGDGWRAWVGKSDAAPPPFRPASSNPLGPFLAAALAAGEVFKRSRGLKRGRYLTANGFSLWSGLTSPNWGALEDGPELRGTVLPPVHVVGAGAVGNGLAYLFANADFTDAYFVVMDDDFYDGTNLNRCLMAGGEDVEEPKPHAIARGLEVAGVGVYPFDHTLKDYVANRRRQLRGDAAREADNLTFKIVVSCVDKRISRQHVQSLWPEALFGGCTLDLRAQSNVYGLWDGSACLGCYNAAEKDGEKLRALERGLRNMPRDECTSFLKARGLDAKAILEYLDDPKCGSVGEAAIRDFASAPQRDFSAGFVSLGAALLLGSAIFRHVLFRDRAPERSEMTTLNFLTGGFADTGLGADPDCELNCRSRTGTSQ